MTRRNKQKDREDFDSQEEYEEYLEKQRMPQKRGGGLPQAGQGEPDPVIYESVVRTFVETHEPASWPLTNFDVMFYTLGDLRRTLAAIVPFGTPDAMPKILQMLSLKGFEMQSIPGFTEPVMPVAVKYFQEAEE